MTRQQHYNYTVDSVVEFYDHTQLLQKKSPSTCILPDCRKSMYYERRSTAKQVCNLLCYDCRQSMKIIQRRLKRYGISLSDTTL